MVKTPHKKKQVKFYANKGDIERTDYSDGTRTLSMLPELEEAYQRWYASTDISLISNV